MHSTLSSPKHVSFRTPWDLAAASSEVGAHAMVVRVPPDVIQGTTAWSGHVNGPLYAIQNTFGGFPERMGLTPGHTVRPYAAHIPFRDLTCGLPVELLPWYMRTRNDTHWLLGTQGVPETSRSPRFRSCDVRLSPPMHPHVSSSTGDGSHGAWDVRNSQGAPHNQSMRHNGGMGAFGIVENCSVDPTLPFVQWGGTSESRFGAVPLHARPSHGRF